MGAIGDIELFASLGEESAKRFAPAVTWRTYPANELVIDMDDTSNDVLFVVSGSVRVIHRADDGKQVILGERIGSRREVVSRALRALEKDALVEKTRGALVLTDPSALNQRISLEGLWVKLDQ